MHVQKKLKFNSRSVDTPTAQEKSQYRYFALALITIILALSFGDRAALSVAGGDMSKELGINSVQMGYLFSAFSWAYVVFLIPSGWLTDRFGSKLVMAASIFIWSIFTVCMGAVHFFSMAFPLLLVLRFALGVTETPVGPGGTRVIAAWFPTAERGVAGAIFNSAQYIALAVFTPFMGWLAYSLGWQWVFITMGCVGVLIALLWWSQYHLPVTHPQINEAELHYIRDGGGLVDLGSREQVARQNESGEGFSVGNVARLFRSRMLLGVFVGQYCVTAITWFYVTWFPIYLVKERGFDILQAGMVASIPAVCGLIGAILSGFFSDYVLRRSGSLTLARKLPIISGLLLSSTMILCNYTKLAWVVIALMSLAFFGKGFGNLGFSVVADVAPKEMVGVTGGVFNAVGNCAGIVTPVVIGYLVQQQGSFAYGLAYVAAHGIVGVIAWLSLGRLYRLDFSEIKLNGAV